MKKTIVCNIFAGPSAGKSVLAAEVFAALKKRGEKVELASEWVKKWAWSGISAAGWSNAVYILAKQLKTEAILYGKVDVVVTDSPLGLPAVYEAMYDPESTAILSMYKSIRKRQLQQGVHNLDLMLVRQHPYQVDGRYETEDQALQVDCLIRRMFPGLLPIKTVTDVTEALSVFRKSLGCAVSV